ncbi:hypothetical protein IQ270_10500 [Microcoleus sp. LEGE 07076]|uniref:hypothetical protein n=1 Tax=Microcoleus sp. LEGE 07076 TaxID=915322 RepID=UPI00187FD7E2|nr:hypothetical protein [Microcoleus sp. LEGE 07076]MBE9185134.1 hypothetical protein [Microcoleus sp. LEGE 07076]
MPIANSIFPSISSISRTLGHSSQPTATDNFDAAQQPLRAIGRQQPRFLVNLVELAGRSND